jgi:prepilin-type N-terminal cleavage/methylation domain-containing protein
MKTIIKIRKGRGPGAGKASGGFTVVELLVVAAILAILASLLLPALARAKASTRKIVCISQQKQWAQAFNFYADDHDDFMPQEGVEDSGKMRAISWADVLGASISRQRAQLSSDESWFNALPGNYLNGVQPASSFAQSATRNRFYTDGKFFHCPSARFPRQARNGRWLFPYFSMAMNSQLITPMNRPSTKMSQIKDPSKTPLFLDGLLEGEERVHPLQAKTDLGQPAIWANRFAGRRHGRGGVMVFADTHATWLLGEDVVETKDPKFLGRAPSMGPNSQWETRSSR